MKQFIRWLFRDRRTPADPLAHLSKLSKLNMATDRRHDRRALSENEFARRLDAARNGGQFEGSSGLDRAMTYTLAAWPGFRERKFVRWLQRSLDLIGSPPTVAVEAREKSNFLANSNHAGLFADFHSCRHLFITSLERAGARPKVAQKLARHSDIRLTLASTRTRNRRTRQRPCRHYRGRRGS